MPVVRYYSVEVGIRAKHEMGQHMERRGNKCIQDIGGGRIYRRKPLRRPKSRVGDSITQDLKYFERKNGVDTYSSGKGQVFGSCVHGKSLRVS